jgi:hypothetical protein
VFELLQLEWGLPVAGKVKIRHSNWLQCFLRTFCRLTKRITSCSLLMGLVVHEAFSVGKTGLQQLPVTFPVDCSGHDSRQKKKETTQTSGLATGTGNHFIKKRPWNFLHRSLIPLRTKQTRLHIGGTILKK